MSINGSSSTFLPFTISGLTDATFSNSNIGNGIATTLQVTTATPSKIARFDANQYLVSAAVDTTDLVPYSGATGNVNLGSNTLTANKVVAPTAEIDVVKVMSSGDDYSLAVNANNLEIKNLTTNQKIYTDGESLWVPERVFAGDTVYSVDSQLTGSQYFRYGLPSQFSEGVNINDNFQISDDTGAAVLEISKATGTTVAGLTSQTGKTANLNSAIKTVNNPLAIGNPGVNAPAMTAVAPSTYTLVSGFWRFVSPSATTGSMQFPPYFTTTSNQKYILTLTGCSTNGTAPVVATVYNATTLVTISDAPKTITNTASTITFTFTTGSSPCTVYINFSAGAINYFVQWSALSVQECDTEVIGSLILDSPIISNVTQAAGTTTNLAGGLLVNQTSTGVSAATFTQTGVPATAPACTITYSAPTYTLAGAGVLATWLGSGTTYLTGAKYYFTFGTMYGSQALQLQVVQYNTAGSAYISIGDYYYGVSTTSSTISGSFVPGSNVSYTGSILFMFVPTLTSQNVKFNTFTMTRADTQITGIATLPPNAGTATSALGLNSSNQIVSYSAPSFSGVSVGYVPYESAADTFSNSLITQSGNTIAYNNFSVAPSTSVGYAASSFTAGTGIGSISYSAPTYTANSSASYQGIINLPALSSQYLNLPCLATFTNLTFPLFAVAPYPYFTLTSGATVVYTSAVGASGTINIPFTPTSSTLFITIYFKAPFTPFTGAVFTWNTFTMGVYTATMNGFLAVGTNAPTANFQAYGTANICGGTNFANLNNYMASGSLTIGDPTKNYGGSSSFWNSNTAGLLLECLDSTEIAVHDAGTRVASAMYYTNASNSFIMGRNMGWGVSNVETRGDLFINGGTSTRLVKNGDNANYYATFNGGNSTNAPFIEFYAGGTRRMYIGNSTTTDNYIWAENSSYIRIGTNGSTRMSFAPGGDIFFENGFREVITVGLNGYGQYRMVQGSYGVMWRQDGSDTYLLVTNPGDQYGSWNSLRPFRINNASGTVTMENNLTCAGGTYNFQSLPQNYSDYAQVCVMAGDRMMRSQAVAKSCAIYTSVAWGGGVNIVNAFYRFNAYTSQAIIGRLSYYVSGSTQAYYIIRIYSQQTGQFWYFQYNNFTNVTFNHITVPVYVVFTSGYTSATGWFDIYVYNAGNCITDGNDILDIHLITQPVSGF